MKKTPLLAILAAGVVSLCFVALEATAQQSAPRQPSSSPFAGKVVVLDVNYVFKKHERFKALINQLKNDADAMDVQMKKEEGQLRTMTLGLQKLNTGSPEFKKQEEDIARAKADWSIKVQQQRREFMMREAKIYNDTYKEIESEVDYFCQANGILLVNRFTGDPVDENNPDSILSSINKPVVWYDKSLDITPYILKRFAAPAAQPADTRGSAAPYNGNQGGGYTPPAGGNPAGGAFRK